MNPNVPVTWIPLDKIESIIQAEPALLIVSLAIGSFLGYKVLLRKVAEHRHRNLQGLFRNLLGHLILFGILYAGYTLVHRMAAGNPTAARFSTYLGALTIFSGATAFVKTFRILVFEYLFLSHMRVAVPLLLVNLSTLLLSISLAAWFLTEIFSLRLAPLLATSAIFSVLLGLALQDTLGNLFAGIALQFDKPYEIGDWVEIQVAGGSQKWVGQIHEVTWRATVLIGWGDETITVPNKVMSQAQVANFATRFRPIVRRQTFRIAYGSSVDLVRSALLRAVTRVPDIRKSPAPMVLLIESEESWITARLIYFIDDYGAQFVIGDRVINECLAALQDAGVKLAGPRISVEQPHADAS